MHSSYVRGKHAKFIYQFIKKEIIIALGTVCLKRFNNVNCEYLEYYAAKIYDVNLVMILTFLFIEFMTAALIHISF